jgi:hypothetical protein
MTGFVLTTISSGNRSCLYIQDPTGYQACIKKPKDERDRLIEFHP